MSNRDQGGEEWKTDPLPVGSDVKGKIALGNQAFYLRIGFGHAVSFKWLFNRARKELFFVYSALRAE